MNTVKLSAIENDRLRRILSCDLDQQKKLVTMCFILTVFNLLAYPLIGIYLLNYSIATSIIIGILSATFLLFIGMMRLGYYKLFRIIHAITDKPKA